MSVPRSSVATKRTTSTRKLIQKAALRWIERQVPATTGTDVITITSCHVTKRSSSAKWVPRWPRRTDQHRVFNLRQTAFPITQHGRWPVKRQVTCHGFFKCETTKQLSYHRAKRPVPYSASSCVDTRRRRWISSPGSNWYGRQWCRPLRTLQ